MRRCDDEAKECLGLDHPGQNKKERRKQNDSKKRRNESRRPGLDHQTQNRQHRPGTRGGQTPQTESPATQQAARAAAAQMASSGDKRRPDAPDWVTRGG